VRGRIKPKFRYYIDLTFNIDPINEKDILVYLKSISSLIISSIQFSKTITAEFVLHTTIPIITTTTALLPHFIQIVFTFSIKFLTSMTFKVPVVLVVIMLFFNTLHCQVTNPTSYLGYRLGEKFVRHHQVVNYFKSESQHNPNKVVYQQYGVTNEGNPLFVVIVSTKNNIHRLEDIRKKHLSLIGQNNLLKMNPLTSVLYG
jgi:hypothetical protein